MACLDSGQHQYEATLASMSGAKNADALYTAAEALFRFLERTLRDDALWLVLQIADDCLVLAVKHFTWLAEQAANPKRSPRLRRSRRAG